MTPREVAEMYAPVCPVCSGGKGRHRCRCCKGKGKIGTEAIAAAVTEERERAKDALYLVETVVKDVRDAVGAGAVPRVVSVEPG